MAKKPQAYRRIGEVAAWLEVPTSTVRFWTTTFRQVRPVQRTGGRRYYRIEDMVLLGGIRTLLRDHDFSIEDLKREMKLNGVGNVAYFSRPLPDGIENPETIEINAEVMTFQIPDLEIPEVADEPLQTGAAEEEKVARVAGGARVSVGAGPLSSVAAGPSGGSRTGAGHDAPEIEDAQIAEPEPGALADDEGAVVDGHDAPPPTASSEPPPLPSVDGAELETAPRGAARRGRARADVAALMRELEALRKRMGR